MKQTKWKHLLRSIKKSGVSFVAVFVIAAVSIAIFQGFQSSGVAMQKRADLYFTEKNLETLEITCANGVTDEDIQAIAGWEGVQSVEGGYTDSVLLDAGEKQILVQARSLQKTMNLPTVLEGTLPQDSGEVALEETLAVDEGIQVGDTITLSHDGCLLNDSFVVTAILNIPNYCSTFAEDSRGTGDAGLGSNDYFIAFAEEAFDRDYYSGCYTTAYVDSDVLDGIYYYSSAYEDGEAAYLDKLEPLAQERAALRYDTLWGDAQVEIADAQAEIDDAKTEIADGEQELEDARTEIAENETKLEDARTEIAENEIKLEDARTEIAENEITLEDAREELASSEAALQSARSQITRNENALESARTELAQGEAQYDSAAQELEQKQVELAAARVQLEEQLTALGLGTDLDEALVMLEAMGEAGAPLREAIQTYQEGEAQAAAASQQLAASWQQLESSRQTIASGEKELAAAKRELASGERAFADAQQEVADGEQELEDAKQELADGEQELEDAKQELADGEQELEDAKQELADGEQELEDAKQELANGEQELEDAQEEVAELQLEDWILSGRQDIGDIRGIQIIVDTINGLSYTISSIFLLVAVVISFSAITRLINEQRILVGAEKALGLTAKEIFRHYMLYNVFCGVLGTLLGWLLAVVIVENLSLGIFAPKLLLGDIPLAFVWLTAAISAVVCLGIFLAATLAACGKLVKEPATSLLRGEIPTRSGRMFFEKWKGYQKLNLYSRTMIRNALNDRGRLLTTIVGIMGCTALLVSCFTMQFGIRESSVVQFEKYAFYDYRLVADSSAGSVEAFEEILQEEGIPYARIQDKLKNFRAIDGGWQSAHVVTTTDVETLRDFMKLVNVANGQEMAIPEDGVLVSRRAAESMGLSAGSELEVMDSKGRAHAFTVAGVIEHYLPYHLLVVNPETYASVMGEDVDESILLIQGDPSSLAERLQELPGFLSLRDNSNYTSSGYELDTVIAVCVALSAVMSVLVILNQIATYINRKARELAVMRVNGYTTRQTKAYVYKDNVVLVILGLLAGCVLGIVVGYLAVRVIEAGAEHFVRTPNLMACLLACAINAVFAIAMNLLALRKIDHLSLTNVSSN